MTTSARRNCPLDWIRAIVFFLIAVIPANVARPADDSVTVEAFAGSPFGVGLLRQSAVGEAPQPSDVTFDIESSDSRVFYPAFFRESSPGSSNPARLSARGVLFLFRGTEPVHVSFSDGRKTTRHGIAVLNDETGRRRLLNQWWQLYRANARGVGGMRVVENYTTAMLARRLGLQIPKQREPWTWNRDEMLGSLLGFEELRLAMQTDRLLNDGGREEPADQPLPEATLPPAIAVPDFEPVEFEPLASRVPEECFYVRFGGYENFRWFHETLNDWGGNLREIAATRSFDYDIAGRLQRQLVLSEGELTRLLGSAAIRDLAIIGTDTFVREGAAIGVLLRERQPGLLAAAINAQRVAARTQPGVMEQSVDMHGVPVSLLTSPGNVIRSYYVADGEYHFVTTSSMLARRFIEAGRGQRRLSDLKEFQYARTKHRADDKAILIYLSDPFIRQLVSPAYRVEMTRRMRAEADVELVSLARWAARGEGAAHASLDDLINGGFLPPKFGRRADDSIPLVTDGQVIDSLRGARRTFLPVADVLVAAVTPSEAEAYRRFAEAYQRLYRRMDPVSVRITREPLSENRERIVLDLSITPFTRQNLGALATWLPRPTKERIAAGKVVVALLEVGSPQSRLFGGLLDESPQFRIEHGQLVPDARLRDHPPVVLGEHGSGLGRQLLPARGERTDGGYIVDPNPDQPDRWFRATRQWDDWWATGFSLDTLRRVTPELRIEQAERPAQVRLTIGDLGSSRLGAFLRAGQYVLERQASEVNARLLNAFTQQLNVRDAGAIAAATEVLGAAPVCPLGGEYRRDPSGFEFSTHQPWHSSAWAVPANRFDSAGYFERLSVSRLHEPPADYESRLLRWFKGLEVELQFEGDTMFSRIAVDVAR
jgi:hypothetical protein